MSDVSVASDLDALERFVLDAEDLTALESLVGRFNVFHALGVARAEIRHSNALAWLLDPGESHALGDLFLKPVVMDLLRQADRPDRPLSPAELDGADLNRTLIYRERKHIDLTIHSADPAFVIAIENKIDAKEHSGQLGRYAEVLRTDFAGVPALRVFLTPDGDEPGEDGWVAYSYTDLHAALTRTRRLHAGSIGGDVGVFIDHYLSLIGSELMDDPKIDELCQRIYKNHKRAIQLIVERAASQRFGVLPAFADLLKAGDWAVHKRTKTVVQFVPKSWLDWIPPIGLDEQNPKAWFRLGLISGSQGVFHVILVLRKCADERTRAAIMNALLADEELGLRRKGRSSEYARLWSAAIRVDGHDDTIDASEVATMALAKAEDFVARAAKMEAIVTAAASGACG